jgi:hypothetical protein
VSLALITIELETRKEEEEKQSKRKNSNEHIGNKKGGRRKAIQAQELK